MADSDAFIVTVDGPSGSGKGSLAVKLARELGFSLLDSGAIYRLVAIKALREKLDLDQEDAVVKVLDDFDIHFEAGEDLVIPFLDGEDVTSQIRTEEAGEVASQVARHPRVRQGLMALQKSFFKSPGLVADGRDMGTEVFPEARFKFYLYASVEIRAQRRYKQLINMGLSANIAQLQAEISERDERDSNRPADAEQRLTDVLDRIQQETGVTIRNFERAPEITSSAS